MPTSRLARVVWRLTGRWRHGRFSRRGQLMGTGIRLSGGALSEPQPVQGPRLVLAVQAPRWVRVDEALALRARLVPHLAASVPELVSALDVKPENR